MKSTYQRPFLKWAGGKFKLLDAIRERLPPGRRFIEPFLGSGVVFLNTSYPENLLADTNADLIHLYTLLKEDPDSLIAQCRELFTVKNSRAEAYYRLRDEFNANRKLSVRRAALFVYFNRHGYNGLCRFNSKGVFNVPFGDMGQPQLPESAMRAFAERAQQAQLRRADFRELLAEAGPGDVVYCDPPYQPLSATASFTAYAAGGFGREEQHELARLAGEAAARGATVLISNHDLPEIRSAYEAGGATITELLVRRSISCAERGSAAELLALFTPAPRETAG